VEILATRNETRVVLQFKVTSFFSLFRAVQERLRADGR